mmetsp:Transcript_47259/g.137558  ORF Transcript_47259/g.137558 Transcript_47259/m.137558 type:complete len:321 (+) Transcript_47259:141-1103(+)
MLQNMLKTKASRPHVAHLESSVLGTCSKVGTSEAESSGLSSSASSPDMGPIASISQVNSGASYASTKDNRLGATSFWGVICGERLPAAFVGAVAGLGGVPRVTAAFNCSSWSRSIAFSSLKAPTMSIVLTNSKASATSSWAATAATAPRGLGNPPLRTGVTRPRCCMLLRSAVEGLVTEPPRLTRLGAMGAVTDLARCRESARAAPPDSPCSFAVQKPNRDSTRSGDNARYCSSMFRHLGCIRVLRGLFIANGAGSKTEDCGFGKRCGSKIMCHNLNSSVMARVICVSCPEQFHFGTETIQIRPSSHGSSTRRFGTASSH